LQSRGAGTPLAALQAAFSHLRRSDLADVLRRYRRLVQRRRQRRQSRLTWTRPGAVWAADFKERREPIEGRFFWLLSIKDLSSRRQLAWEPMEEARASGVTEVYERLFAEHGPPLVLKSDNGGPFKADITKEFLYQQQVIPLYSPKRRPSYNGGVERANGQLHGYQQALAEYRGRGDAPTRADAAGALRLANELARPAGWQGPTADELWQRRTALLPLERREFVAAVDEQRTQVRAQWDFGPYDTLTHDQAAAVDRRAVRDVLLAQGLLLIEPRRRNIKHCHPGQISAHELHGAGILKQPLHSPSSMVDEGQQLSRVTTLETVNYSTHYCEASGND
jgi:transposase InsO family protein